MLLVFKQLCLLDGGTIDQKGAVVSIINHPVFTVICPMVSYRVYVRTTTNMQTNKTVRFTLYIIPPLRVYDPYGLSVRYMRHIYRLDLSVKKKEKPQSKQINRRETPLGPSAFYPGSQWLNISYP